MSGYHHPNHAQRKCSRTKSATQAHLCFLHSCVSGPDISTHSARFSCFILSWAQSLDVVTSMKIKIWTTFSLPAELGVYRLSSCLWKSILLSLSDRIFNFFAKTMCADCSAANFAFCCDDGLWHHFQNKTQLFHFHAQTLFFSFLF